MADALDAEVEELVVLADEETSLGSTRLRAEVRRTTGQLRLFAEVLLEGSYLEATIDHADPSAAPPKPDLRRTLVPLGPVAVFTASNFPFAFSVAGGDSASALASGVRALGVAHNQTDHDDGFAAIRYSVLFTTPPDHERISLRGALDLACELAKVRHNSGLLAAQAHLDGPLGAPAHDDRVELCRQLLRTLVAYALTASPNPDLEAARVLLAKACGQPPT